MAEENTSSGLALGGWLFCQTALLVLEYGFAIPLPWWVRWFPTLIALPFMVLFAIILAVIIAMVKR